MGPVLERLLVCPRCHGKLATTEDRLRCVEANCGFVGSVTDGIVNIVENRTVSFFDSKVPVMLHGANEPGSYAVFYAEQARLLERELEGADVIVDVGCGPRLMYRRPPGTLAIGVDLSYESLRHNTDVDVRVWGSVRRLPLADESVDAVVCFYVLHHLVAATKAGNRDLLRETFREFARILRPGGRLFVFEVAPWWPIRGAQQIAWDAAKRILGARLDMFFWSTGALVATGQEYFPAGSAFQSRTFRAPRGTMFAPMFAVPWIRLPRLLYPFAVRLYQWRLPGSRSAMAASS